MTREEAIIVLQKIKPTPCRADGRSMTHLLVTIALDMAIKALEQEPISEKIKLIVAEWKADTWKDNLSYECMVKIAKLVEPKESEGKE